MVRQRKRSYQFHLRWRATSADYEHLPVGSLITAPDKSLFIPLWERFGASRIAATSCYHPADYPLGDNR